MPGKKHKAGMGEKIGGRRLSAVVAEPLADARSYTWGFFAIAALALFVSGSALAALSEPGILTYVNNSAVLQYIVWDETSFSAAADPPVKETLPRRGKVNGLTPRSAVALNSTFKV